MAHQKTAENHQAAVESIVATCKNKARLDTVLADALDRHTCSSLYLEWTSDRFWGLQMPKLLDDLNRIYNELVRQNITHESLLDFNDGDDTSYFIPHTKRVIVHTGQSFRFIYIWEQDSPDYRTLHVRRFYDVWRATDKQWEAKEVARFKAAVQKDGYKPAIVKAGAFTEQYADDYVDNPHPNRYSLGHYLNNGFNVQYGDYRDNGYILTWQEFGGKVEGSMQHHGEIKLVVECFIPCLLQELLGRDTQSATDSNVRKDFDSWPKG